MESGAMVTRSHFVLLHYLFTVKKKKKKKRCIIFEGEVPEKFCALLTEGESSFLGVFLSKNP